MPRRLGRPSGVDHTNGGERRMYSNSKVSHATLILLYHASILTIHDLLLSRSSERIVVRKFVLETKKLMHSLCPQTKPTKP